MFREFVENSVSRSSLQHAKNYPWLKHMLIYSTTGKLTFDQLIIHGETIFATF